MFMSSNHFQVHVPPSRDSSPPPKRTRQGSLSYHLPDMSQLLPTSLVHPQQPLSEPHYTDPWEVLYSSTSKPDENNPWCVFWHEWWGVDSPGKTRLEVAACEDYEPTSHRILTVSQDAVWRTLRTLQDSSGSILLRDEFTAFYNKLFPPLEGHCQGVLVNGQPGIGERMGLYVPNTY